MKKMREADGGTETDIGLMRGRKRSKEIGREGLKEGNSTHFMLKSGLCRCPLLFQPLHHSEIFTCV